MASSPAPWDAIPRDQQMFVLITGTNSGVGLGTCQRLIDEFLERRGPLEHLIIVVTTRSAAKARETVAGVRAHLAETMRFVFRGGLGRVHLASIELDLCDLRGVYAAAQRLKHGTVTMHTDDDDDDDDDAVQTVQVRIPRLDVVVFNAGMGAWMELSILGLLGQMWREGITASFSWPTYKVARVGARLPAQRVVVATTKPAGEGVASPEDNDDDVLGEVFCANVLGHYVLAHELMALLSRTADDAVPPGRIVWTSSTEPVAEDFRLDDLQGLASAKPYESSKRLTDILALTAKLPGVVRFAESFYEVEGEEGRKLTRKPRLCLGHPGIVASGLFPLPMAWMWTAYVWTMMLMRWLGGPWHVVTGYLGAAASVWLALGEEQEEDNDKGYNYDDYCDNKLEGIKWGSSYDVRTGRSVPKMTEVDGWGWTGDPDRDREALRAEEARRGPPQSRDRARGRRPGARLATRESRDEFEALGAQCWREMERLRRVWERRVKSELAMQHH